jgi:glycosyltransferase involved in cell wall biosynthesis
MPDGSPWPRISIVTPSFQQAAFVEETMRSILLQGYPNLEYIVIDGGSTDETLPVIQRYERWLDYWVSESDSGQSHAINKGFARCTGDIVTFCNSDDIYLPGTFADVASAWASERACGAIVGSFFYIDAQSGFKSPEQPPILRVQTPADLTLGPPGVYRLHQAATFFTRPALLKAGFWVREELHFTMDRDLLYRVCRHGRVVLRNRAYGGFRTHRDSKTGNADFAFCSEFARVYLSYLSGNKQEDRLRKIMARHRMAKAFALRAKKSHSSIVKIVSLWLILYYCPNHIFRRPYYKKWWDALVTHRGSHPRPSS